MTKMSDDQLDAFIDPLFDQGGPIKAMSDAAWHRRREALGEACVQAKAEIVAIVQRVEMSNEAGIERLQAALGAVLAFIPDANNTQYPGVVAWWHEHRAAIEAAAAATGRSDMLTYPTDLSEQGERR